MVLRTVLTRSGLISINTARLVNTVQPRTTVNNAGPLKNVINNAYSTARRPFNKITTANNSNFTKKVNIVKGTRVNTARPKAVISVVKGNKGNAVKASACWVWRPKHKVLDHVSRKNGVSMSFKRFAILMHKGNPQQDLKDKGVIDSGCSRHMTGNRSYLTDYEEIDGGFVAFRGRKHALSFMKPFGCPITILNTIDHLGKFDGKADEGFFVGYSTNSKAFRVFNSRTRIVEENMHVKFNENTPNIAGSGPKWIFDIDTLTKSINYKPVVAGNQFNGSAGTKVYDSAGKARVETIPGKDYVLLPLWTQDLQYSSSSKDSLDAGCKSLRKEEKKDVKDPGNEDSEVPSTEEPRVNQEKDANVNSTNNINTVSSTDNAAGIEDNVVDQNIVYGCVDDPNMPNLKEIVYSYDGEDVNAEADMNNLDAFILVYRNKKDERVARIEAIRLFLAYASFNDFVVYQMDMKSAFLYGKIEEKVYVCQPLGFEDPEFPNKVYKVEKALYGLHQAPKAWYETLSTYLLDNGFQRDDIIFGSTKKVLCIEFEKLMHKKFQMNSMGELTFFLEMQVTQRDNGIFISQDKYVTKILKKFGFSDVKTASTPMETHKPVLKDADGEDVDEHLNRSMIRSLMIFRYLKGQPKLSLWYPKDSPFDLVAYTDNDYAGASLDRKSTTGGYQFLGCRLASWQCKKQTMVANSTTEAEYIATSNCCGQVLWIQNQLLDYGYNFMQTKIHIDNESTIFIVKNPVFHSKTQHIKIRHHFIRDSNEKKLIQMIKIHTDQNVADLLTKAFDVNIFQYLIATLVDKKKVIITETSVRSDLQLEDAEGTECLPNDVTFKQLTLMGANTTAWNEFSSTMASAIILILNKQLEIYVTPSHTKKIFANMKREGNGFSSRVRPLFPTMMVQAPEELDEAANVASVSIHSNDLLLSGEDRIQITELMNLCTNLKKKVLDLEEAKTAQAKEIASLKKRFKKLEKRRKSRTPGLKRLRKFGSAIRIESSNDASLGAQEDASKQGRKFTDIDQDEGVTLIDETHGRSDDNLIATTTVDELTLAQILIEIKAAKPKAITTAATTTTTAVTRPKARGVVVQEPKEEKLARQREEDANIAEWDDVQAMIDADYELTIKLQAIEQGELSIEEKSRLFVELMNKRKKHFARLREEEQRRKPPTKAQKRNTMSTYLKNMAGYKHNQLKTKSFEDIQMLFDKEMKRVITFVDMDTELVKCSETRTKGSSKRVGDELESDNSKKQKLDEHIEAKIDDDQEEAEMKKHMDIVQDDEVAIDAIPLATKPPIIVEWKIIKEGKMGYFQLIRANKSSKRYSSMIQMLQNIDREYLETLWNLVKAKHENTRPEDGYERVLWEDLKVMFEPDIESEWDQHLDNGIYDVVERVMRPLALRQTCRPRSDHGKARHSVSLTSAHHNHGSSSHQGDDDEYDGASLASTPSLTTYLNSLRPLDYQQYDVPTYSKQNDDLLFERQSNLLNQTKQMHKELRGGFKSFGKALRGVFNKKKK
ncbi:putative ribonuclease H-like domain-containing protein [Tanacetum coccineum]